MKNIEGLKELLRKNIKELKDNTCLNISKVEFKGDEIIVLNRDNKVIFRNLIKNYDTTFESQKEFILNVADKATSFLEVLEDLVKGSNDIFLIDNVKEFAFKYRICIDNVRYFDVLGKGDIYKNDTFIWIKEIITYEEYKKICIRNKLDNYIKEIKNKIKNKGVRVVAYCDVYYKNRFHEYRYRIGFYVSAEMHKDEVWVNYIENSKTTYEIMTLYYSSKEDKKEADKVVESIIEILKK